jgi:hypothetical protein
MKTLIDLIGDIENRIIAIRKKFNSIIISVILIN